MSVWKHDGQHMQYLDIHFLNVGHGDCTFVEFPDRLTMIDINNCKKLGKESEAELRRKFAPKPPTPSWLTAAAVAGLGTPPVRLSQIGSPLGVPGIFEPQARSVSILAQALARVREEEDKKFKETTDRLTDPIDYYKANFGGRSIFRYIQSHPDMDHMGGLYRLCFQEKIEIVNFWDTKHCIEKDEDAMRTGEVNHEIRDWYTYLMLRKRAEKLRVLHLTNGARADFYAADGISIWAPFDHSQEQNAECNPNDLSYLLHIRFGQCRIVLGGDAPKETWEALHNGNKARGWAFPKVNLLKASHHGRNSGYYMPAVRQMSPDLTIMSVGDLKAKDDATASYEQYSRCFSTLQEGNILARCFVDGDVWLYDQNVKRIATIT